MADDPKRLLKYIVKNLVLPVESKEAQLDASAAQDVPGEIDAIAAGNMEVATSQSEELSEGHYRYTFDVDWQRLSELARKAGVGI
jgi:hypothetical protein